MKRSIETTSLVGFPLATAAIVSLALGPATGFAEIGDNHQDEPDTTVVAENNAKAPASEKNETVYVSTDASGTVTKTEVTSTLKNSMGSIELVDESNLTDIKSDDGIEFSRAGTSVVWEANGKDVVYTGTTNADNLPLAMHVSYKLDGKEVSPDKLLGATGTVTIRYDFENKSFATVDSAGSYSEMRTPFMAITGFLLDNDSFKNVKITNGKVVEDGSRTIAIGYAFPGLSESLGEAVSSFDMPSYFELSMDAVDFELKSTLTMVSPNLLDDFDSSDIDTAKMSDASSSLSSAMSALVSGSSALTDGLKTLASGAGKTSEGASQLAKGADSLAKGTDELVTGVTEMEKSAAALPDGVNSLYEGSNSLADGLGSAVDGASQLESGAYQLTGGLNSLLDGTKAAVEGTSKLIDGSSEVTSGLQALKGGTEKNPGLSGAKSAASELAQGLEAASASLGELSTGITSAKSGLSEIKTVADNANALVGDQGAKADIANAEAQVQELVQAGKITKAEATSIITSMETALAKVDGASQSIAGISGGLDQAAGGLDKLAKGAGDASKQIGTAATGAQSLSDGIGNAVSGVDSLIGGTSQLTEGLTQLKSGDGTPENQGLQGAIAGIGSSTDANSLIGGATALAYGANQLKGTETSGLTAAQAGASQLASGLSSLNEQAPSLVEGITKLKDGVSTLNTGAKDVASNLFTLSTAIESIAKGASEAASGSGDLTSGLGQFKNDGIGQIVSIIDNDILGTVKRLDALSDEGKSYDNYSGITAETQGTVKFVYETQAIAYSE